MAAKTVLLPREWNPVDVQPEREDQVIVKYGPKDYGILWYDTKEREWCDTIGGDAVFADNEDACESIKGWDYLIEQ